jgi:polar amino acid transport system substrate-binding protein
MFWRCMLTAAVAVGSLHVSVAEANTDCNTNYQVKSGDTLSKISRRIYGDDRGARRLHEINRAVIGRDAALIEIGQNLWIPCDLGDEPDAVALTALVDDAKTSASPGPQALRAPLRVLAGAVREPLIGPELPRAGMLGEMLTEIAAQGGFAVAPPAHAPVAGPALAALLTAGGFDLGFPWTRTDCAACGELIFSDPFYDAEMGFYANLNSRFAEAGSVAELAGTRICRPVTLALSDLEANGLADSAEILRLDTEEACFGQLAEGRVDLVSVDAEFAAILLERTNQAKGVRRLPYSARQVLHAVVWRGHPQAGEIIAEVNRGLEGLRMSGRWFDIVHRHMARYPMLALRLQPRG